MTRMLPTEKFGARAGRREARRRRENAQTRDCESLSHPQIHITKYMEIETPKLVQDFWEYVGSDFFSLKTLKISFGNEIGRRLVILFRGR